MGAARITGRASADLAHGCGLGVDAAVITRVVAQQEQLRRELPGIIARTIPDLRRMSVQL
jgi:hypothetical protein